jgi:hypothetical protein
MQKSTTFTMIFRLKKCHFHYDMKKKNFRNCISKVNTKLKDGEKVQKTENFFGCKLSK